MMLGKFFPFILLIVFGCSSQDKVSLLKPRPKHNPIPYDQIYRCRVESKKEIFLGNSEHYSYFQEMINRLKKDNIQLNGVEKFTLWALSQSLLRPDHLSPDSHTVIVLNYKKTSNFFKTEGHSKKGYQFGLYKSLEFLLKRYKSNKSLQKLVNIFDEYYSPYITAGNDLANFLLKNKLNLEDNRQQFPLFFRGEDLLLANEVYRRPFLKKMFVKLSDTKTKIRSVKFQKTENNKMKCNFDIEPYLSGKLSNNTPSNNSYFIGYQFGDFTILLGSQTNIKWKKRGIRNIFANNSTENNSPLCYYKDRNSQYILSSHRGKDPAQTLSHFYQYGIDNLVETQQVYQLTNFARHLILKNPTRILYESQRGTEDQLKKLNSLNIPIYHAKTIGEISGLLQIKNQRSNFLLDDRSSIRENCRQ